MMGILAAPYADRRYAYSAVQLFPLQNDLQQCYDEEKTRWRKMKETTSPEAALLRHTRLQTIALYAILILLILAVIFIAVQFSALRECMDMIDADLRQLDMTEINRAIDALRDAADSFAAVDIESLNTTVSALKDAADTLASVNIQSLNRAVLALEDAAKNLSEVDVENLNALVGALEAVSEKLQNVVNGITGIFSR